MGPLKGFKIVEFAGIGPGPFCAMLLADMGAEVVRIDRTAAVELGLKRNPKYELNRRNRRSVGLDLKLKDGVDAAMRLIKGADALIEGFRPGVMERLGLGPDVCLAANPKLVYGRMTGWGQEGPLAQAAGVAVDERDVVTLTAEPLGHVLADLSRADHDDAHLPILPVRQGS